MSELTELFIVFFKLGAFTIGGGIAMLPLLQNTLIEEKKWFTKEEFVDIVAVCQSLPGVVAINMATYVGYKRKGLAGSLVSTFGVTLPSFVLILLIARGITALGDNSIVMGAMAGLRAAALGLVVIAMIQLAPAAVRSKRALAAAVLAFVLITVFNINTAYVILLFLLLGIAAELIGGKKAVGDTSDAAHAVDAASMGHDADEDMRGVSERGTCDASERGAGEISDAEGGERE